MTTPRAHVPAWLSDAVSVLASNTNAEGVALVGSQARGDATVESDYDLLVIADDEHVARLGWPVSVRWEQLPGFVRPVEFVTATMAEVMAGLYCGHLEWLGLTTHLRSLFDPNGFVQKIIERALPAPRGWFAAQIAFSRMALSQAEAIAIDRPGEAALILARSEITLLDALRYEASLGTMRDSRVLAYLAERAPAAALYTDQAILSQSTASRVVAFGKLIDGIESAVL